MLSATSKLHRMEARRRFELLRYGLGAGAVGVAAGFYLVLSPAVASADADTGDAAAAPSKDKSAAASGRQRKAPAVAARTARAERDMRPILRQTATPSVSPSIGLDFSTTYANPAPGYGRSVDTVNGLGVTRLRMYDVIPEALTEIQAGIPNARVSVAIPNGSVSQLATDPAFATSVLGTITPYSSIVDTIVVGNEVDTAFSDDLAMVTNAVKNMQTAIADQQLTMATTVSFTMGIVTNSYPPSNATLNPALAGLTDLLGQLTDHVEIDIYPLITLNENPGIPLAYALGSPTCLKSNNCAVVDQDVTYHSLFWAEYDAVRWALNKANVSLPLYVGETGWATNSVGGAFPAANVANAQDYNQNLVNSLLLTGSPKFKLRDFPVNIFEFVDENDKTGGIFEPYWGLYGFSGNQLTAKYSLDLTPSGSARPRFGRVIGTSTGTTGNTSVVARNGWKAFEVISSGDDPAGDGVNWSMPGAFDGIGARVVDGSTVRLQINHEDVFDGTISEVDLDLAALTTAIANTISRGSPGGVRVVTAARQAYDRWTADGGATWTPTSDPSTTQFDRFCSGQSYRPDTFGAGRGFVDDVYITGEEVADGRLFAIDLTNRDLYQLSGVAGPAEGGMPFDAFENAALIDTGETGHIALLLSPDGGTRDLRLYIGEKGRAADGSAASDFLSRNGLAYGSYYYLNGELPAAGTFTGGTFDTTADGAVHSGKLEDVDTSPGDPTRVVIGVQETGLFTFRFQLDFSGGGFDPAASGFTLTRIQDHNNDTDGLFGDADNVDWTAPTALGGQSFPDGLIFVNEDSGTSNGETWMMRPDGSGLIKIADTIGVDTAGETSGILDISALVGYLPGSVLLTSNQGSRSSLTVLVNPSAQRG